MQRLGFGHSEPVLFQFLYLLFSLHLIIQLLKDFFTLSHYSTHLLWTASHT